MTAWCTNAAPFDADHPCLPGHFPGNPIVPGTLILERVLDSLLQRFPEQRLGELVSVKFLSPLKSGQPFHIQIDGDGKEFSFECLRGEEVIATGKLKLIQQEADA